MSLIHKWIRSGQVRVNKKRAKPFAKLNKDDIVRIPPFAPIREKKTDLQSNPLEVLSRHFPIVYADSDVLIINKPSGLAVHPGSNITASITQYLQEAYAHHPFIPAPAHRLDKNTSGLLAIGLTHASLVTLSNWFAIPEHTHKHYLCWVEGDWHAPTPVLEDYLVKSTTGNHNMVCVDKHHPHGLLARSHVHKLTTARHEGKLVSLLQIHLETGRTHQIRTQLSSRGHPIMGDVRYGGQAFFPMLLHAYELHITAIPPVRALPVWPLPFSVSEGTLASQ